MQYLSTMKLFLFNEVYDKISQLDSMDDECNFAEIITNVNNFLTDLSKKFVKQIFRIVYDHVNKLELNVFGKNKSLSISHVKNIYRGILSNSSVNELLEIITNEIDEINQRETFDINKYGQLMDYIEKLDFVCTFDMYSYLLMEDVEGVLGFILDKIVEETIYTDEDVDKINSRVLSQINSKINIFKEVYNDEEIYIVEESKNHIIYKINQVLRMVRV